MQTLEPLKVDGYNGNVNEKWSEFYECTVIPTGDIWQ